jgi:hypothetical protein
MGLAGEFCLDEAEAPFWGEQRSLKAGPLVLCGVAPGVSDESRDEGSSSSSVGHLLIKREGDA